MARVSVFYDKELKERLFMVRGDEGYARSTITQLSLGERDEHLLNFDLNITVNVLRDVGEGQIVIYDNDVAVYVIDDWKSTDNARTITLDGLTYDVTHNFYARYMGNNKCLASKSKTIGLFVENTHTAESLLTITNNTTQYNPQVTNVAKTITLTNNSGDSEAEIWNHYQQIEVFYDEISLGVYSTGSSNTVNVNIPNIGGSGSHILKAVYRGRRELSSFTATQKIKVGYDMRIIEVNNDKAIVFGSDTQIPYSVSVHDWDGNPFKGTVFFKLIDNSNNSIIHQGVLLNINGNASKSFSYENIVSNATDVNAVFTVLGDNNSEISVSKKVDVIKPTDLTIDYNMPFLLKNGITKIMGKITPAMDKVETKVYVDGNQIKHSYTNSNGRYSYDIKGNGRGDKLITVKCGNIYKSLTLPDYIQYWIGNTFYNRNLAVYNADVDYLNMYTRIVSRTGEMFIFGLPEPNLGDFQLKLKFKVNNPFAIAYLSSSPDNEDWNSSENINSNWSGTTKVIPPTDLSFEWTIRRVNNNVVITDKNNKVIDELSNNKSMPRMLFVRMNGTSKLEMNITELILKGL